MNRPSIGYIHRTHGKPGIYPSEFEAQGRGYAGHAPNPSQYTITHSLTTDNLEMPNSLQPISLDYYPEETPEVWRKHAKSIHTALNTSNWKKKPCYYT